MAIVWADNFQNYGSDAQRMLDGIYSQVTSGAFGSGSLFVALSPDPDPLASGNVLRFDRGNSSASYPFDSGSIIRKLYDNEVTTAGVAYRFFCESLPSGDTYLSGGLSFTNPGNIAQVSTRIRPNGAIEVSRGTFNLRGFTSGTPGGDPGVVLGESVPCILPNSWNHVEIKVVLSNTNGSVEIRVNGIPVLVLNDVDTIATTTENTIEQLRLNSCTVSGAMGVNRYEYYKDLIMWDTSGSVNNDFLGSCSVYTLYPNADDTLTWAPSTGSDGWSLIDEASINDLDFISAGDPPPSPSLFNLTNLPPDIVSVKALIPVARSRKIDGGDGSLQIGLKGTLTDLGNDSPITTAFTYRWNVSELSPDTAAPWSPAEADNVKLQVNRTL